MYRWGMRLLAHRSPYLEMIYEDNECDIINTEWTRLNNLQKKAYKDEGLNTTTKEMEIKYGVEKYNFDNWEKFHKEHVIRYNELAAINNYLSNGTLPKIPHKPRGVYY